MELRWNLLNSSFYNGLQKELLFKNLRSYLTKEGDLIVNCSNQRSREQNINEALSKFQALLQRGLFVPKKRKPTKVPYSQKVKRLTNKKIQKEKKKNRKIKEG